MIMDVAKAPFDRNAHFRRWRVGHHNLHTGLTPLGIYASHHNPKACRVLIEAGADPNARIEPLDISPREAAHAIESPTIIHILEQPAGRRRSVETP